MKGSAAGGGGGRQGRTGLLHPLEHYAREFDASERTVKRWRGVGEEAKDACPLDDPEGMVAWWSRNMTQRTPPGIEAAVVRARKSGVSAPIGAARPVASVPAVVPAPVVVREGELQLVPSLPASSPAVMVPLAAPVVLVPGAEPERQPEKPMPEGRGLLAELERLEELAASLSRRADERGQAKAYLDTVQRMATISSRLREEGERLGKLKPTDQVETAIHDFLGPIVTRWRGMAAAMCEALGIELTPEAEEAWNGHCDRIFGQLKGEVFAV